jgi:hypothetical protein
VESAIAIRKADMEKYRKQRKMLTPNKNKLTLGEKNTEA